MNGYTALGIPVTDSREMNPSGERGASGIKGFVQQSRRPTTYQGAIQNDGLTDHCNVAILIGAMRHVDITRPQNNARQSVLRVAKHGRVGEITG